MNTHTAPRGAVSAGSAWTVGVARVGDDLDGGSSGGGGGGQQLLPTRSQRGQSSGGLPAHGPKEGSGHGSPGWFRKERRPLARVLHSGRKGLPMRASGSDQCPAWAKRAPHFASLPETAGSLGRQPSSPAPAGAPALAPVDWGVGGSALAVTSLPLSLSQAQLTPALSPQAPRWARRPRPRPGRRPKSRAWSAAAS